MLIINNRFLSLYDYNFLLVIEKIFSENSKICLYALKGLQINMHLEDKNKEWEFGNYTKDQEIRR